MKTTPSPLDSLEAQLRRSPPAVVPTDLHESIVSAVRSTRNESPRTPTRHWQPWLTLALATMLFGAGLWSALRPRPTARGELPGVAVMEEVRETAQQAAASLPNPLADELECLSRDFNGAVSFVAARVPVGL